MTPLTAFLLLGTVWLPALLRAAPPSPPPPAKPLIVRGGGGEIGFDQATGRIVLLRPKGSVVSPGLARTPASGNLWSLRLRDGRELTASDFLRDNPLRIRQDGSQSVRLIYASAQGATVTVAVTGSAAGVDLSLATQNLPSDALDAAVPSDLMFETNDLRRVLFPEHLGIALKPAFFLPQPTAAVWDAVPVGPDGLNRAAGASAQMLSLDASPVPVTATETGRQWLGAELAARWEATPQSVNRPPEQKPDVDLLTSSAGSFLGGRSVGQGLLVRFGGGIPASEGALAIETVERLLAALAKPTALIGFQPHGRRVVLLRMPQGPARGQFCDVPVADWQARFSASAVLGAAGLQFSVADSVSSLRAALEDKQTLALINPYGEAFPADDDPGMALDAVHRFLGGGGVWLATGGYSFYTALKANPFVSLEDNYPSRSFSDFARIEGADGAVSLYGVQNAHDADGIFVPAAWRCFGDAQGGHLQRRWQTFLPQGKNGHTPSLRLRWSDADAQTSLRAYAADNGLDRPLGAKMTPRLLALWKRSLLIKLLSERAGDETALLDRLPAPAVAHLVSYLRGSFDRQYPDHLPPNPSYGTAQQFRQVITKAHNKGDIVMPYTNTTWWCDNPKGPTFEQAGEAPLLVRLDGQPSHEVYGSGSSGWSVSPFHPAVTQSVDRLVAQFTQEYPADILFCDQNGARGLMYDLNPASPSPYADTQGMINLVARASAKIPVATEDGFDHLLNVTSEFCGLTQELVAFPYDQDQLLTRRLPDKDWEFFPMAQYVAHDKVFFTHHDLGAGVHDRSALVWSLALGYGLGKPMSLADTNDPSAMKWLTLLASLQRTLGPHYMGSPLRSFRYLSGSGGQGVMEAVYGDLRIVADLTDHSYKDGADTIAAHGFSAAAPGIKAGIFVAPDGTGEMTTLDDNAAGKP